MVAIGLDVGGTKMAGGLVDLASGQVLKKKVIATLPKRGGLAVLRDALDLAGELKAHGVTLGLTVASIGVGVAELVDPKGNVTSSQTIEWRGIPVQSEFSALAPSAVESDVRAAALAEAWFGAGRPFKIFAYVTVGTGISHSLVIDGVPYAGSRGNALVMASGPWTSVCPECRLQFQTVLEEVASGPAVLAFYEKDQPGRAHRTEDVIEAAEAGDPVACRVVEAAGAALGSGLGFLINVLDPEAVVVGGGLGMAGGLYWRTLVDSARRHTWSETSRNLPILQAGLGTEAGVIGAALAGASKQAG